MLLVTSPNFYNDKHNAFWVMSPEKKAEFIKCIAKNIYGGIILTNHNNKCVALHWKEKIETTTAKRSRFTLYCYVSIKCNIFACNVLWSRERERVEWTHREADVIQLNKEHQKISNLRFVHLASEDIWMNIRNQTPMLIVGHNVRFNCFIDPIRHF